MSRPVKRSVNIAGHSTSVSLEAEFWQALQRIARDRGSSLAALLREIDAERGSTGLSSAARLYVLAYLTQSAGSSENSFS